MRIDFQDQDDLTRIHETSLAILEGTGLVFHDPPPVTCYFTSAPGLVLIFLGGKHDQSVP